MNKLSKLGLLAIMLATALTGCKDPDPVIIDPTVEITVTTDAPTDITATTAQCGGRVTVIGEAQITELGVCWSTENNPTATGNHLFTTTVSEPFSCTLTELQPEIEYHVRAYALCESEYHYGQDLIFTTLADNGGGGGDTPTLLEGELEGLFSVSENLQVHFSQGNLQYQASTNTWRFAENQTDYVGEGNANIGETYDGWIDLFGWGTSGYNHGANAYQPWSNSTHYNDYFAYGNVHKSLFDENGQADWGYNTISNGGNTENSGWRTLSREEWEYLMESRTTVSGIHFANACVDGVNGMLLFPDNWDGSFSIANPDHYSADFNNNIISAEDWTSLQSAEVVFLPAAGARAEGTQTAYIQTCGAYWSSTAYSNEFAYSMYFIVGEKQRDVDVNNRELGASVRLVKDESSSVVKN
ncbi:MAG: hypothetical protein K5920_06275 [Bacteroidales bacterium]|nr:hypothetical protein [Bacteroidales bacterium]